MSAADVRQVDLELRQKGLFWGDCKCGRPLDRHSRRKVPNAGSDEYACGDTKSGRFESETIPHLQYEPGKGLFIP